MAVVTLVLQWGSVIDPTLIFDIPLCGWNVKVNGLPSADGEKFRNAGGIRTWVEIHTGTTINFLMTPQGWPIFSVAPPNGASVINPPVDFITECLNHLAKLGYKVISSHPIVATADAAASVWTLQKSENQTTGNKVENESVVSKLKRKLESK